MELKQWILVPIFLVALGFVIFFLFKQNAALEVFRNFLFDMVKAVFLPILDFISSLFGSF